MRVSSFAIPLAFAIHSNAAVVSRQTTTTISNSHLANFRTYGSPGCSADNQGEYNFQIFDLNICYQFPLSITVESVVVENLATGTDVLCNGELNLSGGDVRISVDTCASVYAFTDEDCTVGEIVLPAAGTCFNYNATVGAYAGLGSYKTVCSSLDQ